MTIEEIEARIQRHYAEIANLLHEMKAGNGGNYVRKAKVIYWDVDDTADEVFTIEQQRGGKATYTDADSKEAR